MIKEKTRTVCSRRFSVNTKFRAPGRNPPPGAYEVVTPCMDRLEGNLKGRRRFSKPTDYHLYSMSRSICADD